MTYGTIIKSRADQKFLPILLDSLRLDSVLDFDLFMKVGGELVLYRSADLPFTDRTRQKLLDHRVEKLFVSYEYREKYQRYIEANLDKILVDPTVIEEKKAAILYDTSTTLVKDVLANPTLGD